MANYRSPVKNIVCYRCGLVAQRSGQFAKYCLECSEIRSRERSASWTAKNRDSVNARTKEHNRLTRPRIMSAIRAAGKELSEATPLTFEPPRPELLWVVRFRIPFSWSASKNHIYGFSGHHVHKRAASRQVSDAIALATRAALRDCEVVQNKLWVGLHVEKPNQRGDGINVVDLVCDGIKVGADIDDRWFCLSFLDWSINKRDPHILIQIGQDSDTNVQACSHCGRLLDFGQFNKKSNAKNGIDRACRECRSAGSAR